LTKILKGETEFKQPKEVVDSGKNACHSNRGQSKDPTDEFMFAPAFTGQISEK